MKVLNWLNKHLDQINTPEQWAVLLEIKIIDPDGWRGQKGPTRKYWFKREFTAPIDLQEFLIRVGHSTIAPTHPGSPTAWLAGDNVRALQEVEGGF